MALSHPHLRARGRPGRGQPELRGRSPTRSVAPKQPRASGVLLSGISGWFSLSLWHVGAEESGAAKNGLRAQHLNSALTECLKWGRVNLLCHGHARDLFLNSQCRRDAARADRAAWAVQRLLAAAATLSATGSASPRPDRTSWLGGLRRAFSPAFRAGSLYPLARGCRRIWRGEKRKTRRKTKNKGDC